MRTSRLVYLLFCLGMLTACGSSSSPTAPGAVNPASANPAVIIDLSGGSYLPNVAAYSGTLDGAVIPPPSAGNVGLGWSGRLTPGVHELRMHLVNMATWSADFRGAAIGNTGGVQPSSITVASGGTMTDNRHFAQVRSCSVDIAPHDVLRATNAHFSGDILIRFTVIHADYTAVC